jgi:Zn-dependent M28 family amino/carboxypeptidase
MRMQIRMPGTSFRGPLPPLTSEQRALETELRFTVEYLAGTIGERNVYRPQALKQAEAWLQHHLEVLGYEVRRQTYDVAGVSCVNLDVEIIGREKPGEIVVVGAHYDSVMGCPAANDNGTGVAAVLALARRFAGMAPARTLRFVLFVNEEPPHFWTEDMGSLVYAKACRERNENIVAMITPETIGCYSDEPGSQNYPQVFSMLPRRLIGMAYPNTGNFIAFVGMYEARDLVTRCVGAFRRDCQFPSEGAALPSAVPMVGASDHWSFWRHGYPALMITDTAPFRYPHYHRASDTPDKIDFPRTARVVSGLRAVVEDLASG